MMANVWGLLFRWERPSAGDLGDKLANGAVPQF